MTTTISPLVGHGPWTQQGVGTSPGYDAIDARRNWSVGMQEGALTAGSYEVTQRGAGANLSVDIAASTGDGALVLGEAITGQGLYLVPPHSAVINETITAAHATLPRVDRVVLEIKDQQHDASGSNLAQTRVIAGTATVGATLDNLTGAAAVPSSALLLADVLVPATDTTISNSQIRDRRAWAQGAYKRTVLTSGAITTTSAAFTAIDATNLNHRIECTGNPVRVSIRGAFSHSVAGSGISVGVAVDGAAPATRYQLVAIASATTYSHTATFTLLPSAGSHLLAAHWLTAAATATVNASASFGLEFEVEEITSQNTANNATTSG
jgi:hypothetical protein